MIHNTNDYQSADNVLVESDNAIEYKSLEHMYLMQELSNSLNLDIIRCYQSLGRARSTM